MMVYWTVSKACPLAVRRSSARILLLERFQSKSINRCLNSVRSKKLCLFTTSSTLDEEVDEYAKLQQETRSLVHRASFKVRGSVHHAKLRRAHVGVYCRALREGLIRGTETGTGTGTGAGTNKTLYRTNSCDATKQLRADLGGIGANKGVMPDFSNPDALRGYALDHFGRALLLSELVTQPGPDWLQQRVSELFSVASSYSPTLPVEADFPKDSDDHDHDDDDKEIVLASLGGGCGYDFVALAALSDYLRGPKIAATVYEYEPAWKDIVADVETAVHNLSHTANASTRNSRSNNHHNTTARRSHIHGCGFDSCDITAPLDSPSNESLAAAIDSIQIFSCSYVVAENAIKLRQTRFEFFKQLFSEAPDGSLFLFTETTHRLWPEILDLVRTHNKNVGGEGKNESASIRVAIPHIRCGKSGWHLALLKNNSEARNHKILSPWTSNHANNSSSELPRRERELYERFRRDNIAHLSRLDRGWKRDVRKVRGAK